MALLVVLGILLLTLAVATSWTRRARARRRLYEDADLQAGTISIMSVVSNSALARWLTRAGYHGPNAVPIFLAVTVAGALLGLISGQVYRLTIQDLLVDRVATVPGSAGDVLGALLASGPWILFMLGAFGPMGVVRSARRARAQSIERDLPLALEMLATMADAGLGFDAALSNIIRARGADRPLMAEFVKFQVDMQAGMPRTQALRQLARRVHVASLTGFTSALVQAEQVGASIAETLQHQAADLRQRRREEALLQAQALPVKLVFPLVICFLPGVFLSTLAPVLYQMVQVANSVLRGQ